jgi:hypothetical protein
MSNIYLNYFFFKLINNYKVLRNLSKDYCMKNIEKYLELIFYIQNKYLIETHFFKSFISTGIEDNCDLDKSREVRAQ